MSYYDYHLLLAIVDPAEVKYGAKVKSQHFVRTAGSVNLDSRANNQDQSPRRRAPDTTDQVSVHLRCPASTALTDTYDSSDAGIACRSSTLMDQDRKGEGDEDGRRRQHECWGLFRTASGSVA